MYRYLFSIIYLSSWLVGRYATAESVSVLFPFSSKFPSFYSGGIARSVIDILSFSGFFLVFFFMSQMYNYVIYFRAACLQRAMCGLDSLWQRMTCKRKKIFVCDLLKLYRGHVFIVDSTHCRSHIYCGKRIREDHSHDTEV